MAELKLDLAVDARQAIKGVSNFGDALQDVVGNMKDVSGAGDSTQSSLEQNFRSIAHVAGSQGEATGSALKKSLKRGLKDVGKEAGNSGKEAASGFAGGFTDVQNYVQDVLANSFAELGPEAATLGVLVAGFLGTVLSNLSATETALNDARDAAAQLAQTLYQNNGTLPMADAVNALIDLLPRERAAANSFESFVNGWVDLGTNIDAVRETANLTALPIQRLLDGLGGHDLDATSDAIKAIKDELKAIGQDQSTPTGILAGQESNLTSILGLLTKVKSSTDLAKESLALVGSKPPDTAATTKALEDVSGEWDDAARSATNYFTTSKTGVESFDWKAYLKGAEESLRDAQKVKGEIFKVPVEIAQEAQRIYKDKGAAAALAYVTAFEQQGPTVKKRMQTVAVAASEDAGQAAGVAFGQSAQSAWDAELKNLRHSPIPGVSLKIAVDDSAVRAWKPPRMHIDLDGVIHLPGGRQIL